MINPKPPSGFLALLAAQFLSALADNALLFVTIGFLKLEHAPAWHIPFLQIMFVIPFILFAPFVGPYADNHAKGRVLMLGNGIKLIGAILLLAGKISPLADYGIVGLGAAIYAPAKYGILTELVSYEGLIGANAWLESSTIVAILLGVIIGGHLADWSIQGGLVTVGLIYSLAAMVNLAIPSISPVHAGKKLNVTHFIANCYQSARTLTAIAPARASLAGTSIFWGTGSAMRFLLIAWVPFAFGIQNNHTAANLNGVIAIGIIFGAILAGRIIRLDNILKILPFGLAIGPLLILMIPIHTLSIATSVLIMLGFCGGAWVVPLNAILQQAGYNSIGSGYAVAVQSLFENLSMLIMVGLYALAVKLDIPITTITVIFGLFIFLGIYHVGNMLRACQKK
ncbi:MAG TPA: lysophospholipid transporter LplT [Burkholderiales bacterium]|nr:lysophospholipid transporter LplT [Burkholderiales bacterium]